MPETTPPGWFTDPGDERQMRWWDGTAWSSNTAPRGQDLAPPTQAPAPAQQDILSTSAQPPIKKPWYFRWWAITAAAVLALGLVGSLMPSDDEDKDKEPTSQTSANNEPVAAAAPSPTPTATEPTPPPVDTDGDGVPDEDDIAPKNPKVMTEDDIDSDKDGVADHKDAFPKNPEFSKDTDGDGVADQVDAFPKDADYSKDSDGDRVADSVDAYPTDPSKSKITLAMENALGAANDYLEYSAFSYQGLIDQLSSEYGSDFELSEATWAVNQLDVDWNEQAVKSAKNYLEFSSFSRQGLIDQLSSEYGSQFTVEQATYAVNKIGL